MRRRTFRLLNIASFTLLLFALYLNFIYKGDNNEFIPVVNAEESTTVRDSSARLISIPSSHVETNKKIGKTSL